MLNYPLRRRPGRNRTGARSETSRGDLPLERVPGKALGGSNISAGQAT